MCNGFQFPAWQAQTIQNLLEVSDVELALIILDSRKPPEIRSSPTENQIDPKSGLFWRLYNKFYAQKKSKALQSKDLSKEIKDTPRINGRIEKVENDTETFAEQDIESIKSYQLDFILKFGFGNLEGASLNAAKFGIWEFHHSDPTKYQTKIPCFWELYNENIVTGASLQRVSKKPGQRILLKNGFLKTELFYPKNIDKIHFMSSDWPVEMCVDIRNNQFENLNTPSSLSTVKVHSSPTNFELVKFFFKQLKILFKKAYKTLFITDYWNIGVANGPIQAFLDPENLPEVEWFPKLPKNKFIADPFGIYYNDKLHIIYEDFLFHERIGTTASLEFNDGKFRDNGIVIKEGFHMSYPFVFNHEGSIYCIPETYQANQVRLYKTVDFPKKWELDRVLIENYAGIDNTLLKHEGNWWLFSTDKNNGAHWNLNIFYAKNVFGPWKRHPKNPVKTDIRSARPAGSVFSKNGDIFRPSMDYSEKVEGRIVINKILKLTETDFKEESICTINPYQDTYFSDKIHTLSEAGSFTIIDGAKELNVLTNFHALKYKIISLIGKLKKK